MYLSSFSLYSLKLSLATSPLTSVFKPDALKTRQKYHPQWDLCAVVSSCIAVIDMTHTGPIQVSGYAHVEMICRG